MSNEKVCGLAAVMMEAYLSAYYARPCAPVLSPGEIGGYYKAFFDAVRDCSDVKDE